MAVQQYNRFCQLKIADTSNKGLDLSALRVTFEVEKKDSNTPNQATIRVYNVSEDTAHRITAKEFTQIMLDAGYEGNHGIVFYGDIQQTRIVREGGTDYFVEFVAGDGDKANLYATVNTSIAAGSNPAKHIAAITDAMVPCGVTAGFTDMLGGVNLPRGKVLYGAAAKHCRNAARNGGATYTVQDGKLVVVGTGNVMPQQAVVLNSHTGLIGIPEQTTEGIKGKCLLNPMLRIAAPIKIDQAYIQAGIIKPTDGDKKEEKKKDLALIMPDGIYRLLTCKYTGDTRGQDWYCDFTALSADDSGNHSNKVKTK